MAAQFGRENVADGRGEAERGENGVCVGRVGDTAEELRECDGIRWIRD
jgi:hypothetical protein